MILVVLSIRVIEADLKGGTSFSFLIRSQMFIKMALRDFASGMVLLRAKQDICKTNPQKTMQNMQTMPYD